MLCAGLHPEKVITVTEDGRTVVFAVGRRLASKLRVNPQSRDPSRSTPPIKNLFTTTSQPVQETFATPIKTVCKHLLKNIPSNISCKPPFNLPSKPPPSTVPSKHSFNTFPSKPPFKKPSVQNPFGTSLQTFLQIHLKTTWKTVSSNSLSTSLSNPALPSKLPSKLRPNPVQTLLQISSIENPPLRTLLQNIPFQNPCPIPAKTLRNRLSSSEELQHPLQKPTFVSLFRTTFKSVFKNNFQKHISKPFSNTPFKTIFKTRSKKQLPDLVYNGSESPY